MAIIELRILPPIAIGRLGESQTPLAAYDLALSESKPLDYRKIVPQVTFEVDSKTGELKASLPADIVFKDGASLYDKAGKVHPVAPFLEVFAITDTEPDKLVPLTVSLLTASGLSLTAISWDVEVGNMKIFRRTVDEDDKISVTITNITTHESIPLLAGCKNFIEGKKLPLGAIQFIKPTAEFPEIRLRYTPAGGHVYGTSLTRATGTQTEEQDPVINSEEKILYSKSGKWLGYTEGAGPNPLYTNPAQLFAGYNDAAGNRISWGYIDDECDGIVRINLKLSDTVVISAKAHISAGPPAYAPDTLPIRVVSDELEQLFLSTDIDGEVNIEEAEDIIRRSFETIRVMNTAVMNGNSYEGKQNVASSMVRQNTNDFGRLYEPIMATSLVDNLAIQLLHERIFNGISTGAAPWFADLLRKPDEIGDLSSKALRKMPALMRGADGRSLTFTYRQINKIIKAAAQVMFKETNPGNLPASYGSALIPSNRTAQLHYRAQGNPYSTVSRSAISNCFPGLEFDFRNLWRRAFKGLVLLESNNYVVDATDPRLKYLIHHRLVAIDGKPTMVQTFGPTFPNGDNSPLITSANPNGVSFMEWSNSMVEVLQKQGEKVTCYFTATVAETEVLVDLDQLDDENKYVRVELEVNHLFDGNSAAFSDNVLQPGELTQSLCAPWQNDYRECSCYYWAASRPDYVNVVPDENGLSMGDNWMSKKRTGRYIPDNWIDSRLASYDDLFKNWQGELSFIIKGKDALNSDNSDDQTRTKQ